MEYQRSYDLLWVPTGAPQCFVCKGPLRSRTVLLILDGGMPLDFEWTLEQCTVCGQWYGLLTDLLMAMMEEGIAADEVTGFVINDEPVRAGIWADPPLEAMPWEDFRGYAASFEADADLPPPPPEEVRALPLLDEAWELGVQPGPRYQDEQGHEVQSYIALVLDPSAGIRGHHLRGSAPHESADLAGLVLIAAAHPAAGTPGRPPELRLNDRTRSGELGRALQPAGIIVRHAPTPLVDAALAEMRATMEPDVGEPYFTAYDAETVRAFFKAAREFFQLHPWDRLAPDRYVAFRIDDGPWSYLSVMGQMGEQYGLSLFDDWMHLCRFVYNQPTPMDYMMGTDESLTLDAAQALEGLSLEPLQHLHPDDADYLQRLHIKAVQKKWHVAVHRFTPDGLVAPRWTLPDYRKLLSALTETIANRRARQITSIKQAIVLRDATVELRYPARGDESFAETPLDDYRLVITGLDPARPGWTRGARVVIDASGNTRLDDVAKAIRDANDEVWITAFLSAGVTIWANDRQPRNVPCPFLTHLAGLPDLAVELFEDSYPMQLMPRMGVVQEITVQFLDS